MLYFHGTGRGRRLRGMYLETFGVFFSFINSFNVGMCRIFNLAGLNITASLSYQTTGGFCPMAFANADRTEAKDRDRFTPLVSPNVSLSVHLSKK